MGDAPDASEVTFELAPKGKQVLMVITHRRLRDRETIVQVAAGWHTHLGLLSDQLTQRQPRLFWTERARLEREYSGQL